MDRFARLAVGGGEVLAICWVLMLGSDQFWTLVPMVVLVRSWHSVRGARARAEVQSFGVR